MSTAPGPGSGARADDLVDAVVRLVAGRTVAVLTGAGISTDSGIPDYRSPGAPPRRPMTYQQFVTDPDYLRTYWARNHVGWRRMAAVTPNAGHHALARLERAGIVVGIVTQNVDRLHTAAGSRRVVELHGTYAWVVCLRCGERTSRAALAQRLAALNPGADPVADVETAPDADAVVASTAGFRVADCLRCGGILKPDIVYFGETVPAERVAAAYELVDECDVLLVAGSSLTVMSGYRFVRHAARAGRPVIVINRGPTRGDGEASLRVDAGCSETLTAVAGRLGLLSGDAAR